jgi:hypothetical protein
MEVNGQLHASAALPRGNNSRYPLAKRLGGIPSRAVRGGEEKKISGPGGNRTPAVQAVVYSLYWLGYRGSKQKYS